MRGMNRKFFNYATPLGLFETWEEAAEACERSDLDPMLCIMVRNTEEVMK